MPDAKGKTLPDPESELPVGEESVIAWATIIKDKTEDGMHITDPTKIGGRIAVNLRTTRMGYFLNKKEKKYHAREIIFLVETPDEWVPTELLDISL